MRAPLLALASRVLVAGLALATSAFADFDQAMQLYRQRHYAEAAKEFGRLVEGSPDYDYGHFMHGVCLFQQGQTEAALPHIRRAIELDGGRFAYHNALATALTRQGKWAEAVAVLDQSAALATTSAEKLQLHRTRGLAQVELGRCDRAIADLEAARALRAGADLDLRLGGCRLQLGAIDAAIADLERSSIADPKATEVHLYLADAYVRRARTQSGAAREASWSKARSHADKATEQRPADPQAWTRRGQALMGSGEYPGALAAFARVLELDPASCNARINRGKCEIALGQWSEAVASLAAARRCAPNSATVLETLGFARLKLGDLDAALELYREANRRSSSASIRDGLARVKAKIEQRAEQRRLTAEEQAAEDAYRRSLSEYEDQQRKREAWQGEDPKRP